jgi:thiamine-phosphate pyrophosphorylase
VATSEPAAPHLPPLYAICDVEVCARAGWTVVDFASACVDGGARLLQIRAKPWAGGRFLETTAAILERTAAAGARIIVNDRADVALLAGAAGVHVGQEDLSPAAARAVVGPGAMVGLSAHTTAQVDAATGEPVTYVAVGPVFGTTTKETGYDAVGADRVRYAVGRLGPSTPVAAIGGITLENCRVVLDAGASSVAVISDLLATGDPAERVRQFLARLAPR